MKKYIITYGIACVEEINGKLELIEEISSITTNKDEAERIVRICNDKQISPTHMISVVEDILI